MNGHMMFVRNHTSTHYGRGEDGFIKVYHFTASPDHFPYEQLQYKLWYDRAGEHRVREGNNRHQTHFICNRELFVDIVYN